MRRSWEGGPNYSPERGRSQTKHESITYGKLDCPDMDFTRAEGSWLLLMRISYRIRPAAQIIKKFNSIESKKGTLFSQNIWKIKDITPFFSKISETIEPNSSYCAKTFEIPADTVNFQSRKVIPPQTRANKKGLNTTIRGNARDMGHNKYPFHRAWSCGTWEASSWNEARRQSRARGERDERLLYRFQDGLVSMTGHGHGKRLRA